MCIWDIHWVCVRVWKRERETENALVFELLLHHIVGCLCLRLNGKSKRRGKKLRFGWGIWSKLENNLNLFKPKKRRNKNNARREKDLFYMYIERDKKLMRDVKKSFLLDLIYLFNFCGNINLKGVNWGSFSWKWITTLQFSTDH